MGDPKKNEKEKTKSGGGDSKTKARKTRSRPGRPGAGGGGSNSREHEHTRRQDDQAEVDKLYALLDIALRAFPPPSACSGACDDPYKCDHMYDDDDVAEDSNNNKPDDNDLDDETAAEKKRKKKKGMEDFEREHLLGLRNVPPARPGRQTLLHVMASKWSSKDPWSPKQKRFLGWMLQHQDFRKLLEEQNEAGCTPMHIALTQKLDEFVNCVLEALRGTCSSSSGTGGGAGGIINFLFKDSPSDGNCFHLATKHNFPNLKAMIKMCAANNHGLVAKNRSHKDTPLHIAVKELSLPILVPDDEEGVLLPEVTTSTTRQPDRHVAIDAGQEEEDDGGKYEKVSMANADFSQDLNDEDDGDYCPADDADDDGTSANSSEDGDSKDGDPETARPKQYRLETDDQRKERLWEILIDLENETDRPRPPPPPPLSSSHHSRKDGRTDTLTSAAAAAPPSGSIDLPPAHSVRLLIEANPEALETLNEKERTPYREREEALLADPVTKSVIDEYVAMHENDLKEEEDSDSGSDNSNDDDDDASSAGLDWSLRREKGTRDREAWARRMLVVRDPVAHYIRSFCVRRSQTREETMTRLYKPGRECHIEFDLVGMPKTAVPHAYLDQLALHLKFESILKYVALPALTIEREQQQPQQQSVPSHTKRCVCVCVCVRVCACCIAPS
jgi:hypothetical protein